MVQDALELAAREPQASSAEVDTPYEVRKELKEVAKTLTDTATLSVVANMAQVCTSHFAPSRDKCVTFALWT